MMDNESLIRSMGEMTAEMRNLNKSMTKVEAAMVVLHNDIDSVKRAQAIQERDLKSLHLRVDGLKNITDDHERLKNKFFGVVTFIGLVFGSVGAGVAYIIKGIIE